MSLARRLAELSVRITPAERRDWAEAIRAELDHVPADRSLGFALGAVVAAVRLRGAHPPFVLAFARYGLAAAALVWAALHLRLGAKLEGLPSTLSYAMSAVFAVGGLITAAAGLRLTALLASPLLLLVGVYTAGTVAFLPQSPNRAFYVALAVEEVFVLLMALLIAVAARSYGRTPLAR
jgi:hypothetical protein